MKRNNPRHPCLPNSPSASHIAPTLQNGGKSKRFPTSSTNNQEKSDPEQINEFEIVDVPLTYFFDNLFVDALDEDNDNIDEHQWYDLEPVVLDCLLELTNEDDDIDDQNSELELDFEGVEIPGADPVTDEDSEDNSTLVETESDELDSTTETIWNGDTSESANNENSTTQDEEEQTGDITEQTYNPFEAYGQLSSSVSAPPSPPENDGTSVEAAVSTDNQSTQDHESSSTPTQNTHNYSSSDRTVPPVRSGNVEVTTRKPADFIGETPATVESLGLRAAGGVLGFIGGLLYLLSTISEYVTYTLMAFWMISIPIIMFIPGMAGHSLPTMSARLSFLGEITLAVFIVAFVLLFFSFLIDSIIGVENRLDADKPVSQL